MAKSDYCCLNADCPVLDCPEPICAMEYPGGLEGFLQDKKLKDAMETCQDIGQLATILNLSESAVQRRFNRIKSR